MDRQEDPVAERGQTTVGCNSYTAVACDKYSQKARELRVYQALKLAEDWWQYFL